MNQKTMIKGKIHYVGVNDRNKHLFEGLWPLPYGVSYNSYLIDDETVALIDTVDACYFEVYLRKIKSIIGERPISISSLTTWSPTIPVRSALLNNIIPILSLSVTSKPSV